ncbi:filamentation induced by cAMP protein fic [Alishewanella aestuarii B11]|uniref:Filamentation induced by cAMP protein fic n=1 Tax=Alishewanella aestuarii B11 TaxID=1197174 RepID=J1YG74_9ALTE|nr:Fic family protein [Alishewanella aestuarii]EJI86950.1 filamentation induced by cAMP protein fic [Alishewanella aestuarii B11]
MWIWQQPDWPGRQQKASQVFRYDHAALTPKLRELHFLQGVLLGKMGVQDNQQAALDTMLANILTSSAIEGERLNHSVVRSSLARKLGIDEQQSVATTAQSDGLATMVTDAIGNWQQPLTLERLLQWHSWLFPTDSSLLERWQIGQRVQGGQLRGNEPMQVVSGRIDRPKVHFEAPPREVLEGELNCFIDWFNRSRDDAKLDPLLRAGIAHFWFITLHPLEDGNGRLARLLTDLALAQAEHQSIRFYAMSVAILERRSSYYGILEQSQKGDIDITAWLVWFLDTLAASLKQVLADIEQTLLKTRFWQRVDQTQLTKEQMKVLNRLLDGDFSDGISNSQYGKVAKVSPATASRHLAQLVEMGCLVKTAAGGRSTRYVISQ